MQITEFANIVIQTIRKMDHDFNLKSQLEYSFGREFKKQWDNYRETQQKIFNGELPINYGEKERNINTFNILPDYDKRNDEDDENENEYFNSLQIQEDNKKTENEIEAQNFIKKMDPYGDLYYKDYLSEKNDFKESEQINTINNDVTEEDEYNDQNIINYLKETSNKESSNKESTEEELIDESKIINNQNLVNPYVNQKILNMNINKADLTEDISIDSVTKTKMKSTKNSIQALQKTVSNLKKNKYLHK